MKNVNRANKAEKLRSIPDAIARYIMRHGWACWMKMKTKMEILSIQLYTYTGISFILYDGFMRKEIKNDADDGKRFWISLRSIEI